MKVNDAHLTIFDNIKCSRAKGSVSLQLVSNVSETCHGHREIDDKKRESIQN